ncbi:MAG TPA: hypothetical protein VIP09_06195 [Dehalococcoidia bacterium]|jgi:hypothetical protein
MSKTQSWVMMGVSSIALVIGVLLATGALTSAQTNTPTTAPSATVAPGGTFKSNEDPTHEKSESADREAQEDSGTFHPGGRGHGSNEDPTHESSESPEREAQEGTGQAPTASTAPGA